MQGVEMKKDYVSEEWKKLVDELLKEGYSIDEAEQVADEECGCIKPYRLI